MEKYFCFTIHWNKNVIVATVCNIRRVLSKEKYCILHFTYLLKQILYHGLLSCTFPIDAILLKVLPKFSFKIPYCQYRKTYFDIFCVSGWMLFSRGLGFARFYCHYWISDIWHRVVPSYGSAELSAPSGNWLSGKNSSTFSYRECNFAARKCLQAELLWKCILKAIHQIKCRKCPFTGYLGIVVLYDVS